jgi:hypothetical protein
MKWLSRLFGSTAAPSPDSGLAALKLGTTWGREVERSARSAGDGGQLINC